MIYVVPMVIFVTMLGAIGWGVWVTRDRTPLARLADPAPLPGELPVAGRLSCIMPGAIHDIHGGPGQDCWCGYIGHDFDTGPLLIVSESMAARADLERSVKAMIEDAEQRIPPRWR